MKLVDVGLFLVVARESVDRNVDLLLVPACRTRKQIQPSFTTETQRHWRQREAENRTKFSSDLRGEERNTNLRSSTLMTPRLWFDQ